MPELPPVTTATLSANGFDMVTLNHMPTPPGPKGLPILGVYPAFRRNPPEFLARMARQYGDVVYMPIGRQQIYFVNHPDCIREILVTQQHKFKKSRILERARVLLGDGLLTSEGELHKRQRRLVQPAFHRERLSGYGETMVDSACAARERLKNGQLVDIAQQMTRLTLDIVARTLFSARVDDEADEIGRAMTDVLELFEIILLPFSEILEKLPLPAVRRFHRARQTLDGIIFGLIAERRASKKDKGDLLSMLLLAQDEEDEGGMTDTQVRDEALTLFLAGHETTANALTWAWYLLSQDHGAEARFHAEIDSVLSGRLPSAEDLANLPYTTAVLSETLRLYPPAWGIGRRTLEDVRIGGYSIKKGKVVLMSPYVTHRDPRWFPEPVAFRPERWLQEDDTRPKFAYFPFGGGARVCVGERFAWMEGVLLLATIAQKWRFSLAPGHPVATRASITLRPQNGMKVVVGERVAPQTA